MSFISLIVLLVGVINLLGVLLYAWTAARTVYDAGLDTYVRHQVALWGGLVLAALPLHVLHWWLAGTPTAEGAGERSASLRKAYLYAAMAVTLGIALVNGGRLLNELLGLALQIGFRADWPHEPLGWLGATLVGALGGLYLWRTTLADGDFIQEVGGAASWRRIYFMLAAFLGLAGMLLSAATLLSTVVELFIPTSRYDAMGNWWQVRLASNGAILLVTSVLWLYGYNRLRSWTFLATRERQAVSQKLYLYGAVLVGAAATLISAAWLLRWGLLLLLGEPMPSLQQLIQDLSTPLAFLVIGIVIWVGHEQLVRGELVRAAETPQQAMVRRLYFYLVAAVALGVFWFGLTDLLRVGLELALGTRSPFDAGGYWWRERLGLALALVVVGGPTWWLHWWVMQVRAREVSASGADERRSTLRKIYLYGVAFIGAVLVMFNLAAILYRALTLLLGEQAGPDFIRSVTSALAILAVAALWWLYHALAIRRDGRRVMAEMPVAPAPPPLQTPSLQRTRMEVEIANLHTQIARIEEDMAAFQEGLAKLRTILEQQEE